ncbi:cell division protein ZapA [Candidatus Fermentibacteria bacterium]|nr:cell division protein ZapA [Candidatus Fermentibacteria bacterium]
MNVEHHARARAIKVTIMAQEYVLSGDMDPDYINRVANYVNGKMKEIHNKTVGMSMTRLAVLAAMNIADEFLTLRSDIERAEELGIEKMEQLESRIGTWVHDSDRQRVDNSPQ